MNDNVSCLLSLHLMLYATAVDRDSCHPPIYTRSAPPVLSSTQECFIMPRYVPSTLTWSDTTPQCAECRGPVTTGVADTLAVIRDGLLARADAIDELVVQLAALHLECPAGESSTSQVPRNRIRCSPTQPTQTDPEVLLRPSVSLETQEGSSSGMPQLVIGSRARVIQTPPH